MEKWVVLISGMLMLTQSAGAHGENQPGPHGGYIRMPGAFHTELKQEAADRIVVYLLDINWKNPTTKKSAVKVQHKRGEQIRDLSCKSQKDRFECSIQPSLGLRDGDELLVKATRSGAQGGLAVYPYPFRLVGAADPHAGH